MNEFWKLQLFHSGSFSLTVGKLAGVILLLLFTTILLNAIKRFILRGAKISIGEKGRRISLFQLIKYFTWVLSISFCTVLLGFDITILVASSAALFVGLGFGLQNIFSDLISGLFMLFERKVNVGDVMEVDSLVGKVENINLRTSVLLTRDGYNIIVPNHKFITENVINWSHQAVKRRFHLEVGVGYSSDVDLLCRILLECAGAEQTILTGDENATFVRFHDFGESSLIFYLMFWTDDIFGVEQLKSNLRFNVFKKFKEQGIEIPFPQRDIHIIKH